MNNKKSLELKDLENDDITKDNSLYFDFDNVIESSNGGKKADKGKPDYSLMDLTVFEGAIKVLEAGKYKYSLNNWKKLTILRIFSALLRHLFTFIYKKKRFDKELGSSHLDNAICNLYFLKYFEKYEIEKYGAFVKQDNIPNIQDIIDYYKNKEVDDK